MARPRNHAKHIASAVEGLVHSITSLLSSLTSAVAGRPESKTAPASRTPGQRGPGKGNPKLKAAIKAAWARMTPAERKARVARMLAGRGLKPKKAAKKAARKAPRKAVTKAVPAPKAETT